MSGADAALELARWDAAQAFKLYKEAYTSTNPHIIRNAAEAAVEHAEEAEALAGRWGGQVGFVARRARKWADQTQALAKEQS